ncbi:GAF and ANTAR domain-containing protein [Streptomyces sp. NPDC003077]|uniref:GAF and ANTAR domain-containing protein n=1 Tax=Streptomyces sp. NPDC003077 TaxID=3154443 RepID=UPI0033AEB4A6
MGREQQLTEAFVQLADTLADDFDPLGLFHRLVSHCVTLLDTDAAGVLMADGRGRLRTMGVSSDEAALMELLQLHAGVGPCVDCYHAGHRVDVDDLTRERDRWPGLAPFALDAGFRAVHALPLRLHERTIGTLGLFRTRPGPLAPEDERLAQALADVAALALLHWSSEPTRPEDILTRTQSAIAVKGTLDIAKGMIAEYARVPVAEAGVILRHYAQSHHVRLADVAEGLVQRTLRLEAVVGRSGDARTGDLRSGDGRRGGSERGRG